MTCLICNDPSDGIRCDPCTEVYDIARLSEPGSLVLIVDGSVDKLPDGVKPKKCKTPCRAGAGLVLARAHDEAVVAVCAIEFECYTSHTAEFTAIARGLTWAPVEIVWSDCEGAIATAREAGFDAHFIPDEMRDPLHNLAHRLADAARNRNRERLGRIWIPTERW